MYFKTTNINIINFVLGQRILEIRILSGLFWVKNVCKGYKQIECLLIYTSGLQVRERSGKLFFYFSTKTYVVGTQKNRLNEAVLLSTQKTCLN